MNLKKLGLRIKTRREKQKLRQIDIANALHVSAQAVSKWERGDNAPDISLVVDLATLLNVSTEWLLTGDFLDRETFPAAVFCTSINGFAEKSKNMTPSDLAVWTNALFFTLTEVVLKHGGVPVKYIGDGFLAFFTGENACTQAVNAAITAKNLTNPNVVIALHYGPIFLGTIGHPDYSSRDILGDTVNTCFLIMPWIAENCHSGIGATSQLIGKRHKSSHCCEVVKINDTDLQIFEIGSEIN